MILNGVEIGDKYGYGYGVSYGYGYGNGKYYKNRTWLVLQKEIK